MNLLNILGQGLQLFRTEEQESPLVRMFRVEYQKEYLELRKNRVSVTERNVREYLKDTRFG